jgi:Bacterial Ig domain
VRLRGQDAGRVLAGGIAIGLAIALAVVLELVANGANRPPVIAKVEAQPAVVARGATATLRVHAEDPDADPLQYEFKAELGKVVVSPGRPQEAQYSPAAEGSTVDRVSVTVRDARGLATTTAILMTIEGGMTPEPTEERTPEPTEAPPTAVVTPLPTGTRLPTRTPAPASTPIPTTALPVADATAAPGVNRPPILHGGTTINQLGENPVRLVVTGNEPDGEPVTFSWDFGECLHGQNLTQFEAEVYLVKECNYAVVTLTWTDPEGASAQTQWNINR